MSTRLLEVPVCHLKLRHSKQECFVLVARVTTAKGRELDPSWLQQHGWGMCRDILLCQSFISLYSPRAMSSADPGILRGGTNLLLETRILSRKLRTRPRDTGTPSALLVTGKAIGDPRVLGVEEELHVDPFLPTASPETFGRIILRWSWHNILVTFYYTDETPQLRQLTEGRAYLHGSPIG